MRPCPPNTGDSARAQRKAPEHPEFLSSVFKAGNVGCSATVTTGWIGRGGFQAVSSLNRLRNSRSASTGSSGSVISNGGRVSRMTSTGMEPSSE